MNKIIYLLLAVCLFTSCENDDTIPFLSIPKEDAQTMRMYVEIEKSSNLTFTPIIYASQMSISWGDNSLPVEYVNADSTNSNATALKPLKYTFPRTDYFYVDIQAVKVTRLDISMDSAQQKVNELFLKDCRHLKSLTCTNQTLESVTVEKSGIKNLDLTTLNHLEDLLISACDSLYTIVIAQNPVLNSVQLSDNPLLTATSLNALFAQLPQVTNNCTIILRNNEGDATCDTSIATQKGWKVSVE